MIEERPVNAGGIRKVSPYFAAAAIAPTLLGACTFVDVSTAPSDLQSQTPHEIRLPGDELDVRLLQYSHDWRSMSIAAGGEVEQVFEARPTGVQKHRAKVRRVKGKRQLAESESDLSHFA